MDWTSVGITLKKAADRPVEKDYLQWRAAKDGSRQDHVATAEIHIQQLKVISPGFLISVGN